jgi:hypothetical protein
MGGTNDKDNLVELTAREHFIAHILLCKMYPSNTKLWYAANIMANKSFNDKQNRTYKVSSRLYSEIKSKLTHTEESKKKIGMASKTRSEETRRKLSEAAKKLWIEASPEKRAKMINSRKGRKHSEETKSKMREARNSHNQRKVQTV